MSRYEDGSSKKYTSASLSIVAAIAVRWSSPPLRSPTVPFATFGSLSTYWGFKAVRNSFATSFSRYSWNSVPLYFSRTSFQYGRGREGEQPEAVPAVLVDEILLERLREADNPDRVKRAAMDANPTGDAGLLADRRLPDLRVAPAHLGPRPLGRAEGDALQVAPLRLAPVLEHDRDAHGPRSDTREALKGFARADSLPLPPTNLKTAGPMVRAVPP